MPIERSTIVGVVAGVLLLGGAVGFAVGLPEAVGEGAEARPSVPTLPDRLDDRMVALSAVTAEEAQATTPEAIEQIEAFTTEALATEREGREHLAELYGDAEVRTYLDVPATLAADQRSRPAQIAVTVVPGEAGLLIPSGPMEIDQPGTHYELSELDGHQCSIVWNEQIDPTTGQIASEEPDPASYRVECRTERDGLTYDVYTTGLEPEEATAYLDLVLEQTAD